MKFQILLSGLFLTLVGKSNTMTTLDFLSKCRKVLLKYELLKISTIFLLKIALVLLDILALLIAGILASAFIPIIQSKPENISIFMLKLHSIADSYITLYEFIFLLAGVSGALLILRLSLTVLLEQRLFRELASVSERLAFKILKSHYKIFLEKRVNKTYDEFFNGITNSLNSLTIYGISSLIIISAEVLSLLLLLTALLIWQPLTTITFVLTSGILIGLAFKIHVNKMSHFRSNYSKFYSKNMFEARKLELLSQEWLLRNQLDVKTNKYMEIRKDLSDAIIYTQIQFGFPRLILETSVIVSGLFASSFVWYFYSISEGLVILATYIVVGFRLTPSMLKIQNAIQVFLLHKESCKEAFELIEHYSEPIQIDPQYSQIQIIDERVRLQIKQVEYSFLEDFKDQLNYNFTIEGYGIFLVKGVNGSGKTTLLELVAGIRSPKVGIIDFQGKNLSLLESDERSRLISYAPQAPMFAYQSLEESFLLDNESIGEKEVQRNKVLTFLEMLRFDKQKYLLHEEYDLSNLLSEGEKQKISLARTLSRSSCLLLLDEPTTSLDSASIKQLKKIIVSISKEKMMLVVTHNNLFDDVAEKIVHLGV